MKAKVALLAFCSLALGATRLDAQTLRGVLRNGESKAPVASALVSILDGEGKLVRIVTADDKGHFSIALPQPGLYALDVRHIGYSPLATTAAQLNAGDTVTVTLDLAPLTVTLDTVVTTAATNHGLFSVTPGREMVARHYALGKGIIVGGWEIEHSGMLMSEYLGTLDGIILTSTIAQPNNLPNNPYKGWSPPIVPAAHGKFLTSAYGQQCLYARIDHWSIFGLMMQVTGAPTDIDLLVQLKDVMAVEVYHSIHEVPPEWQQSAWVDRIVFVRKDGGYFLGDAGLPAVPLDSLLVQNTAAGLGIGRAFRLDSLPPPHSASPTAAAPGQDRMKVIFNPFAVVDSSIALALDPGPRGLAAGIPACGFMQIWTKAAW
jgi:hypothetical protein